MSFGNVKVANRSGLAFVEESAYGVTPSGPPTLQNLLWTEDTLKVDQDRRESEFVRSDLQVTNDFLSATQGSGRIGIQYVFGHYDDLREAVMGSAGASTEVSNTYSDITYTNSDNSINTSGGNFVTDGYLPGQALQVTTSTSNNSTYKIVSVATGKIVVSKGTITDEGSADADGVLKMLSQDTNGTACRSFMFERSAGDIASDFHVFNGFFPNGWEMTIAPGQIINGAFNMFGKQEETNSSTEGDGSNTAAPSDTSLTAVSHVPKLYMGSNAVDLRELTFRIDRGFQRVDKVGLATPYDWVPSKFRITGRINLFYTGSGASSAEYVKWLADTSSDLWLQLVDENSNEDIFEVTNLKFTDATRSPGNGQGARVLPLDFKGIMNATETNTLRWAKTS